MLVMNNFNANYEHKFELGSVQRARGRPGHGMLGQLGNEGRCVLQSPE